MLKFLKRLDKEEKIVCGISISVLLAIFLWWHISTVQENKKENERKQKIEAEAARLRQRKMALAEYYVFDDVKANTEKDNEKYTKHADRVCPELDHNPYGSKEKLEEFMSYRISDSTEHAEAVIRDIGQIMFRADRELGHEVSIEEFRDFYKNAINSDYDMLGIYLRENKKFLQRYSRDLAICRYWKRRICAGR